MKKIILISGVVLVSFSCKKSSKTSADSKTVYCMYTQDGGPKIFRGCATTKEAMQQKAIEMRDANILGFTSIEKSSCSECP